MLLRNANRQTDFYDRNPVARSLPLNPQFSFASFAVSDENRLLHVTATEAAESPDLKSLPVVFTGGRGTGKTHLLHAIGNYVQTRHQSARLFHTSPGHFLSELYRAKRRGKLRCFMAWLCECDVFLLDGAHRVVGKSRLLDALVRIIEAVSKAKLVVVTTQRSVSDSGGPSLLSHLPDYGAILTLDRPGTDLRKAVLRVKADQAGVSLPDETADRLTQRHYPDLHHLLEDFFKLVPHLKCTNSPITDELLEGVIPYANRQRYKPAYRVHWPVPESKSLLN